MVSQRSCYHPERCGRKTIVHVSALCICRTIVSLLDSRQPLVRAKGKMMRRAIQTMILLTIGLCGIAACAATTNDATGIPTVTTTVLNPIIQKVGTQYGDAHPQIDHIVTTTTADDQQSMSFVFLKGQFHKGLLTATGLEFSMLNNGSKVWALRAFTATNSAVWSDSTIASIPSSLMPSAYARS